MLIRLYLLLAAFLHLGVDPPDDPDNVDPPDNPDEVDPLDLGEDDPDPPSPDEPDDPDAIREQLKAERTARETAERNAREMSERATAAEARSRESPRAPSQEQQLFEHEETRLRDPALTAQEKWQIESNRVLRSNQREARQALAESREIADKADFERLKAANPVLKRYEERIEKKLVEIRATGSNIPRKVVAQLLIGEDIVDGKVKSTKRAPEGGTQQTRTVARGKAPSGRSDVRGRGASTEQDKRRARLANQII